MVTSQPTSPIATGGNSTFTVEFTPAGTGTRSATVTIANNDPGSNKNPYDFSIAGTGTATAAPEIRIDYGTTEIGDGSTTINVLPLGTDFQSTPLNTTVQRQFTIRNTGTSTLNINTATFSVGNANNEFTFVPSIDGTTVPAGDTRNLIIMFTPTVLGTSSATVSITSDDADESPYTFDIEGTGGVAAPQNNPDIRIIGNGNIITNGDTSPATSDWTDFGSVIESVAKVTDFTIVNDGSGDLNLTGAGVTITGSTDFVITSQPSTSSPIETNNNILRITFTPSGTGLRTATISIASDDPNDNPYTFAIQGNGVDPTQELTSRMIGDFLGTRNVMLLANQPELTRRLNRLNPGSQGQNSVSASAFGMSAQFPFPVDVQVAENLLAYSASSQTMFGMQNSEYPDINKWDIWSEGRIAFFDSNSGQTGSMGVIHTGIDYLVNEELLLGLRAQFDWMGQDFAETSGNVNGTGWMAGPYAMVKLGDNFYFDVSAVWGSSVNSISPYGTYIDEFTTTRWMINGSLVGEFTADNWTFRPTVSLLYIDEYQYGYTDSMSVAIPDQSVSLGELRFAPRISYENQLENGDLLVPWAEISGIYAFGGSSNPGVSSLAAKTMGISGGVKAGIDLKTVGGAMLNISGQYEGIGSGASSYGASLGLSAPLN